MNKKHLLGLAASLLSQYAAIQSYNVSNDWTWPLDWSLEDKLEFYEQYLLYRSGGSESLAEDLRAEIPFTERNGPPDFLTTSFIANVLSRAAFK
jgi:hypothetical protein